MSLIDLVGYGASALTLSTFAMKTMVPLRIAGIAANVLSIAFAYFDQVYPMLTLHVILLPLNATRLYEMLRLVRRVEAAARGDLNMDWLKPYMSSRLVAKGAVLFRKGDVATTMFYVVSGHFHLIETRTNIGTGAIVGELAFLSPNQTRTQTLECVAAGEVLQISYDQMKELYFQNPQFGFYFLQLTSGRLFENISRLETALAGRAVGQRAD